MNDGALYHSSDSTTRLLARNNIRVVSLCSKNPDLNPMEHSWDELCRRVTPNQSEMFLHTEDAAFAFKNNKRKEHHISPRAFILARNAFRLDRGRQRKETHDKIEKKRRTYINAKIRELGNILPDTIDRALCNRKGTILKEAVKYMKQLQRDQELWKHLESKIQYLDFETRRMAERLEFLEVQPVNNLTNNVDVNEEKTAKTEALSGSYQINSQNQSQMFCNQKVNATCSGVTSDKTASSSQADKLNAEWNGLSAFMKEDDTIYYESSPLFADTLINYF